MEKKGILDPKGKLLNPLNNKPYSDEYKNLAKIWSKFPAYKNAENIIKDILDNQVILVVSGTGSGKTVLLPKYALHAFNYTGKIAITLPKQIVTKSSAEFASKTLDVELGKQVGYKYKGSPKNSYSSETNLLYATDGTIVQRLLNDPELKDFDAVIIDEAHERKVQIDFLLFLLKRVFIKRPNFKLIIMSATINSEIFANYFSNLKYKQLMLSGETNYPIESIYLKDPVSKNDYIMKGFDIITNILKKDHNGDILFFVTSYNEANEFCKLISNYIFKNSKPMCIEVYSGMPPQKEILATDKNEYKKLGYNVKIVVATNVAESSLTIDGIKYVIDGGYEYLGGFNTETRARTLDLVYTTKAQIRQRMGRSGRTGPGICYHLYTKEEFEKFREFPEPDIRTGDISSELLSLLKVDTVQTVENLLNILSEMIEPPKKEFVRVSLGQLDKLGLIRKDKITEKGKIISRLSVNDIFMANCIYFSYFFDCSYEMSLIVGLLDASRNNMKNIFDVPKENSDNKKGFNILNGRYKEKKNNFKHKFGDHFSLLNIMNNFLKQLNKSNDEEKLKKWCYDNFLKYSTIKKARKYSIKIRKDLMRTMNMNNIKKKSTKKLEELENKKKIICDNCDKLEYRLLYCLYYGLRTKKAILNKKNKYDTKYTKNVEISKNSYLSKKNSRIIVFNELFIQNKKNKELNIVSTFPEKFKV